MLRNNDFQRPFLLGLRPSLSCWRPSLSGWRPSLIPNHPMHSSRIRGRRAGSGAAFFCDQNINTLDIPNGSHANNPSTIPSIPFSILFPSCGALWQGLDLGSGRMIRRGQCWRIASFVLEEERNVLGGRSRPFRSDRGDQV